MLQAPLLGAQNIENILPAYYRKTFRYDKSKQLSSSSKASSLAKKLLICKYYLTVQMSRRYIEWKR